MNRVGQLLAFILVTIVVITATLFWQINQFLTLPIADKAAAIVIDIKPGSPAQKVAQQLAEQQFLSSPTWFVWYLAYQGKNGQIKAGEIKIEPQWDVDELIENLIHGKAIQYPVALIAGQTFQQSLQMIQALPKVKKVLDMNDIGTLQKLFGVNSVVNTDYLFAGVEGWLLPETYHYKAGDSDKGILLRAYKEMRITLQAEWEKRAKNLPFKTPYEALILASIVEKETGIASERPLIAGVFVRRLQKGMRLQTDPTVIYGIGRHYDGNIRKKDLLALTPYNTYRIDGLPPTPIALPSKEAIHAVMQPADGKALYFVAKGEGEHLFSDTLEEHNKAVNKYLLNK